MSIYRPLSPAYCFQDKNHHWSDSVVAGMLSLDANVSSVHKTIAQYRMLFAREPSVNERLGFTLKAINDLGKAS